MLNTPISLRAGDVTISGRFREAVGGRPRALIVALHPGSYTSKYFDVSPENSLLDFGSSLGYSVLALDRPGYGISTLLPPERLTFESQVDILRRAIETAWDKYGQGSSGIFLIGNSIGGMISLMLGSKDQSGLILGLEMTGAGPLFIDQTRTMFQEAARSDLPAVEFPHEMKTQLLNGPKWSYREANCVFDPETDAPAPKPEFRNAVEEWEEAFPRVAATVKVPVMFVAPEFDALWRSDHETLSSVQSKFTASPFVDVLTQRHSGHLVELSYVARAFYMKTFAFLEECILQRSRP